MRRTLYIILCALSFAPTVAQEVLPLPEAMTRLRAFCQNINTFQRLFPQEKVYVQTDNTGYYQGETIWWKAYVKTFVDDDTRTEADSLHSKVLYVELVSPIGTVIKRQKAEIKDGEAHGDIRLDGPMMSGYCELRAYTRFQTNFDPATTFSRVIPIFKEPRQEGDYTDRNLRTDARIRVAGVAGDLDVTARYTATQRLLQKPTGAEDLQLAPDAVPQSVQFFPEGGHLVRGTDSRVAFSVSCGYPGPYRVHIFDSHGSEVASASSLHEGRGTLFFSVADTAYTARVDGLAATFALPRAEQEGVALILRESPDTVELHLTTRGHADELLGLTVQHEGSVVHFDTLRICAEGLDLLLPRRVMQCGVNQITLFTPTGRILAERLFFESPRPGDVEPLTVSTSSEVVAPYSPVSISLHGQRGARVAVAVRDAETTPTGTDGLSLASYMLLASDVKGYIARPDYYLESDDSLHRAAADLLMLVQGWRRYDWKMMAGCATFYKNQPREDGLYINGRIAPSRRKHRSRSVDGVYVGAILYNRAGQHLRGALLTDDYGRYVFRVDSCRGAFSGSIVTKDKEGFDCDYRIILDRHFSPSLRSLSLDEIHLRPLGGACLLPLRADSVAPGSPLRFFPAWNNRLLGEARVIKKREVNPKYAWAGLNYLKEFDAIHFDATEIVEDYLSQGRDVPFLSEWLKEQEWYKTIEDKDEILLNIPDMFASPFPEYRNTNISYSGGGFFVPPPRTYANLTSGLYQTGYELPTISSGYYDVGVSKPAVRMDDVSEIFIYRVELEDGKARSRYGRYPLRIDVIPSLARSPSRKGRRKIPFEGYNEQHAFSMPDYSLMPPEPDYRRTLYWNPAVTLDALGRADLTVWNSTNCRRVEVSAEGITADGRVLVLSEK